VLVQPSESYDLVSDGPEGARFWPAVLTDLKNRGVADMCIADYYVPEGTPRRDQDKGHLVGRPSRFCLGRPL
jgi:hypothetical protein